MRAEIPVFGTWVISRVRVEAEKRRSKDDLDVAVRAPINQVHICLAYDDGSKIPTLREAR